MRTFRQLRVSFATALMLFSVARLAFAATDTINWEPVQSEPESSQAHPNTTVSQLQGPVVHYHLERVKIIGNRKTLRSVILQYLEIKPGDLFSAEDATLEESRYRMLATGYFRDVTFELKKGTARGYVILEIRLVERNTIVVNDLSVGMTRITPYWDDIVPFGSIGVEERSFLGTGIQLGATVAASKEQSAYRIYWRDNHFLNSRFGIHVEGLFSEAQEYFGEHYLPGPDEVVQSSKWKKLDYRRAGIRLGTGYNLLLDYFFWCDFRFENILAEEPQPIEGVENTTSTGNETVVTGYVEPDDSVLASAVFGFTRDTTNHPVLPSDGAKTQLSVELSHPILGSDYNFAKFLLLHRVLFPFGKRGQSIGVEGTMGLISGSAPFFDQFFVGDYSAFVPDRKLGLNFSNLHPGILNTAIQNRWYEDLVVSLAAEWSRPIYRGSGGIYGINIFVRFGAFALTSTEHLYESDFPVDITGDFGLHIDTSVGIFSFSFASVLQLIPPIRRGTTE